MSGRAGDSSLALEMRRMLYGHLLSRSLSAAAALGLPDQLADGPKSAEHLAGRVESHPSSLRRLLRALTAFGVFVERADRTFELTPLGETLRSDVKASAHPTALLLGSTVGRAWNELLTTVRTGRPAFPEVFGTDFFSYLDREPAVRAVFDRSQAEGLSLELDEILAAVDFSAHPTIVDVGGGDGALLAHVLSTHPTCRGVLLDLPAVVPRARERLASVGLLDRCELRAGDFLDAVPPGGNLYVLRHILHDWDDQHSISILRACRHAMAGDSALLIIERIADDRASTDPVAQMTAFMDLYMMSLFESRERTRDEFVRLLEATGLALRTVRSLPSRLAAVLEVRHAR